MSSSFFFFFQAEDGIRDVAVTGVQTCALPICVRVLDAQSAADARWIAQCRDHSGDWQVKHCEARVVTLAKGGAITVDPGENGGGTVESWTPDSIEGHPRRGGFVIFPPPPPDPPPRTPNR